MFSRFKMTQKPRVLFCTGAGASKESGVSTFRDPVTGYWSRYDPMTIASVKALSDDPVEVNRFYNERRALLETKLPNYFHESIRVLQDRLGSDRVGVLTTNVDDFHERTGIENLFKIHGNLTEILDFEGKVHNVKYSPLTGDQLYSCRPNVVMFGEGGYYDSITNKYINPYSKVRTILQNMRKNDLIFIVGCSNSVLNFSAEIADSFVSSNVHIVNPDSNVEALIVTGKEVLLKMGACDSVPFIEDIVNSHIY